MVMGHWFLLVLNLKLKKFELIDSLRIETNVELTELVTKAKTRISSTWGTYTT
jgi:Ulp1 family protease